jgi:D-arabinose 1-dehydrogenase-like Zn-dependent alcohol dehydrogenase
MKSELPAMNKTLKITKGHCEVIETPMPRPKEGFVLVKQAIAPNCIENRAYKMDFIEWFETSTTLGHEGVGEIVEVGLNAGSWKAGQRVVIFQGWACGTCWVCERGLGATHCINIKGMSQIEEHNDTQSGGGGFNEYRLVPANMMSEIPAGMSYKHASAANCLIGCTYSPMRDYNITNEHYCVIGGVGFVGLATLVNLKYRGAKVICIGRDKKRMQAAKDMGADYIINSDDEDWLEQVKAITPDGRGADFSFECSGYPYYQQKCLEAIRHYGTMVCLGYAAHEGPELKWELNTEFGLCWGHKTVTAAFDVNFNHRRDILEMLKEPWVQEQVDKLITHSFPMSRAAEAFELLNNRNATDEFVGKVHLIPGE